MHSTNTYHFILLIVAFIVTCSTPGISQGINSKQQLDSITRTINSLFNDLDSGYSFLPKKKDNPKLYFSWFGTGVGTNRQKDSIKIVSGASCSSFYYSKNVKMLFDIYKIFSSKNVNYIYATDKKSKFYVNSQPADIFYNEDQDTRVFDIVVNYCGAEEELYKISRLNTEAFYEIYASYSKWVQLLNNQSINELRKENKHPLMFCDYIWK